jgi:UDP-glucose 4-epimerase
MSDSIRKVLVTGGAGYIGSHVVKQLGEAGYDIVVYDNLSTGFAESVLYGELIVGDLKDVDRLSKVFQDHQFDAVLHFAASLVVPESVEHPLDYYSNNTFNTLNLLKCCKEHGVNQLVFSSTAAVYGEPEEVPVREDAPTKPINPYGRSKLMSEWMIQDLAKVSDLRYVILRYFNVAGADSSGKLGQRSKNATHLIRMACDAALGRRSHLEIYGTDFDTPDGSAIRDFINIEDLASAHLSALHYLEAGNSSQILNCGYGRGYSVREVALCVQNLSNNNFVVVESGRRLGDPACVTASVEKIHGTLDWNPKNPELVETVRSSFEWEKALRR